jgi:hypothetical protein
LTVWVDRVDERWQALGISAEARIRLRHDLVADLAQARLGGASVDELISPDPQRFAEDVATAETLIPATIEPGFGLWAGLRQDAQGFVVLALGGALAGALLSLATVYPLRFGLFDLSGLTYHQQGIVTLVAHLVAVAIAVLGGAAAVRWHFRTFTAPGRIGIAAGLGLIASGALAVLPIGVIAWATNFSTAGSVVGSEVAVVVMFCAYGLLTVARRIGLEGPPLGHAPGNPSSAD